MNNVTGIILPKDPMQVFSPDQACYDWCVVQQVTHSNNLELYAMMLPLFAFFMLMGYFWSLELD